MIRPFFIFALPRSRTAWLQHFLAAPGVTVGHDMLAVMQAMPPFFEAFDKRQVHGSCETAGMLAWKLIRCKYPESRIVVIRRKPEDVIRSLRHHGWMDLENEVGLRDEMLDAVERAPGVRSFSFEELNEEAVCKEIFSFCLSRRWNPARWEEFRNTNIQINMADRKAFLDANAFALANFRYNALAAAARLGGPACLGLN